MQTETHGLIPQVREGRRGGLAPDDCMQVRPDIYQSVLRTAQAIMLINEVSATSACALLYLDGVFLCSKTKRQLILALERGGDYE